MANSSDSPWASLSAALMSFVQNAQGHQGGHHIVALHSYVACRLVIEGGFHPDDVRPRPPFVVDRQGHRFTLQYAPDAANATERTVLGGLKTKDIDVVVTKEGIGPVIAVSLKGTLGAFRNLTNRMEEAVGDCTNLHMSYPALVYGFLHVLRANHRAAGVMSNDVAIETDGKLVEIVNRYAQIMARLAGRKDIRDTVSKYEAVAICLVDPRAQTAGKVMDNKFSGDEILTIPQFF